MTQVEDMDRKALARDLLVFHGKLALDGLKDLALFWLTLAAGLLDLLFARTLRTRLFYRVLQFSHRFDATLDLNRSRS